MTPPTLLQRIAAMKAVCDAATPAPWIIENPMPETLSIVHEPTPNCPTYDWQFVAHVSIPESIEEQDVPLAQSRATADFIADARTKYPAVLDALAEAIEALSAIANSEVSADEAEACNHPTEAQEAITNITKKLP